MTEFSVLYGGSLYVLAKDEGVEERIYEDLALVDTVFNENARYIALLDTPTVALAEKSALIDSAFSQHVHPYTGNFLKILAEKKQVHTFAAARRTFVKKYNNDRGIEEAVAITAVPLNERLYKKLKTKLEAMTGKTVVLENKVDSSILGGLTIRMANKQMDASVRTRLKSLEKQLSERW